TDRIGQRLSGSPGAAAAVAWSAEEFRRDGLARVRTEKVMVPHWIRGEEFALLLSPSPVPLSVTALGMSAPTPSGGIAGDVVEVSSFDELHALGEKARGKIVLYYKPMVRHPDGDSYGAAAGLRYRGASEAAKQGAVAMLIRSLGTLSARLPHTGVQAYEDGVEQIPAAALAAEDADLLHRLLASGERVRVRLSLGCRTLPDAESANVIAELRGSSRPEEVVVIGGHLDSWDLGTGAIDDGAGVAVSMEAMRLLKKLGLRPRRTIRAVLFMNEENGNRGGLAYAEAHKEELASHVAAIESDSGAGRPLGFDVSAGAGGLERVTALARSLVSLGATRVLGGGEGVDIGPMRLAGVPLLSLRQDMTYYFDWHHTAADTLDKVDPRELSDNVAAMAFMAYALADEETPLPRIPEAERVVPKR
ncbi:MAG TPA: M20/M25/M40 family metallo-hydrolase, partial [Candidatus Polarisedimenticolia bacterium]|nr:M20/M25/M40 family metallo-hydrolase [Candidatus Polarisedimenticolia bacterium]